MKDAGRRQLTISAGAQPQHFQALTEFVAKAPSIPGWKVSPFLKRCGTLHEIEVTDGYVLKSEDVRFSLNIYLQPLRDNHRFTQLFVFLPDLLLHDHEFAVHGCDTLIQSLLGEVDYGIFVGRMNFTLHPLSKGDARRYISVDQLPKVLDQIKEQVEDIRRNPQQLLHLDKAVRAYDALSSLWRANTGFLADVEIVDGKMVTNTNAKASRARDIEKCEGEFNSLCKTLFSNLIQRNAGFGDAIRINGSLKL